MKRYSPLIEELIYALRCLPGVGPRSAQRMAFHLLERNREGAQRLAHALLAAMAGVNHCHRCRNLSEVALCAICASERRDPSVLCVVENPADVQSIEQAAAFQGKYFVLMGRLSPLDGVGPEAIGIDKLKNLLSGGEVKEVIIATGATAEGEATAHYIGEVARAVGLRATRIAHGIPVGGELEYVDSTTLSHAIACRRDL
ncbi:MAG: recombination mediator RecR [Gammaproteobacteria bacterium]